MGINEVMNKLGMDNEMVLRRFGNNEGLLKKFFMKFPQDETYRKLEEAVKNQDRSSIEIQAHTLKGVALNMGFDTLGGACSRLVGYVRENGDGEENKITEMFGQINQEYTKVVKMLEFLE